MFSIFIKTPEDDIDTDQPEKGLDKGNVLAQAQWEFAKKHMIV